MSEAADWISVLLRFSALVYAGFVIAALVWFFTFGDGSLKELKSFLTILPFAMIAALPTLLLWGAALLIVRRQGFALSVLQHGFLALGASLVPICLVGVWIWTENTNHPSVLGEAIMRSFIIPSLVMGVVCVPLAVIFARFSAFLKLERLFS